MYAAFLVGTDWLERAAEWVTRGRFCHVELVTRDLVSWSAWKNSAAGAVNVRAEEFYRDRHWVWMRVDGLTEAQQSAVEAFLVERHGAPYNYRGFYGFLAPRWLRRRVGKRSGTYFCSELIVEALQSVGYHAVRGLEPSATSPNDLFLAIAGHCTLLPEGPWEDDGAGASAA